MSWHLGSRGLAEHTKQGLSRGSSHADQAPEDAGVPVFFLGGVWHQGQGTTNPRLLCPHLEPDLGSHLPLQPQLPHLSSGCIGPLLRRLV